MKPVERVKLDADKVFAIADGKNMGRAELSRKCGFTDAWIYAALRNEMTMPKAELIATVLGVTVDDLVESEKVSCASSKVFDDNVSKDVIERLDNIDGALQVIQDEINNLGTIISSRGYRIAEMLEKIAAGINEPWTEGEK